MSDNWYSDEGIERVLDMKYRNALAQVIQLSVINVISGVREYYKEKDSK